MKTFYITTPIYYVNAEPHLGHAYTTIVADASTRYHRLLGYRTRFQTGTDEHGDKIAQAAAKEGIEPKAFVDRTSGLFRKTWPHLEIQNDYFIRTTDPDHVRVVQQILQRVYDAGDIYKATYGGNYCVGCERFITDKELVEGKCPDHGTEPQFIEEENYFFRMSRYQDALKSHLQDRPDFIRPERYKNEVLAMLAEPLEDLCISRPKSRLTWGIELPFDADFVTYVWFDALINYVSGPGWPQGQEYAQFWPAAQHLIAKDILKPHAIYWPTMLMSAGIPLYQHLNVHGYWNVNQTKMSKSVGNVVKPLDLAQLYGVDAFRYFLLREMSFGLDAAFSEEALVGRYNADLANDLGNLFSRVLGMLHKYCSGAVPPKSLQAGLGADELLHEVVSQMDSLAVLMPAFAFQKGLEVIWDTVRGANKYIVFTEPWALAKEQSQAARLDTVMHILTQVLATLTHLVWPVMPGVATKMASALNMEIAIPVDWEALIGLSLLPQGHQTQKPLPLFPRVETSKVKAKAQKAEAKAEKKKRVPKPYAPEGLISIEELAKVQLKVGRITEAAPHPDADRLLVMQVDLGESPDRQIVAGIAKHYSPEDLAGKQVVVVANLESAELRGLESQGMLLAAVTKKKVRLLAPDGEVPPGAKVR